jgi:hypothetical protein
VDGGPVAFGLWRLVRYNLAGPWRKWAWLFCLAGVLQLAESEFQIELRGANSHRFQTFSDVEIGVESVMQGDFNLLDSPSLSVQLIESSIPVLSVHSIYLILSI